MKMPKIDESDTLHCLLIKQGVALPVDQTEVALPVDKTGVALPVDQTEVALPVEKTEAAIPAVPAIPTVPAMPDDKNEPAMSADKTVEECTGQYTSMAVTIGEFLAVRYGRKLLPAEVGVGLIDIFVTVFIIYS